MMIRTADTIRTRAWRKGDLLPHQEMLMFHQRSGPVWDTLDALCESLEKEGIDYVLIGAFALGCYGYDRTTNDVDLCLRPADIERFRRRFVGREYEAVAETARKFLDPRTGVTFDLLISGEFAGRASRNKFIRFPDPAEAITVKDLKTVSLERLIELKLVTWRARDVPDVIELIRKNNLGEDFADRLHPLVRIPYLECYDHKIEEDKYGGEH